MKQRIVLVLDGGGAKGLIQAAILESLEGVVKMPLCDKVDMVVGTSVGGIQACILASGKLSAEKSLDLMYDVIPKMMTRRMWPLLPKYKRTALIEAWAKEIGTLVQMRDAKVRLMVTAVSECDDPAPLTHYFKSWESKDGQMAMLDAALRTSAAPIYFGGIVDENAKTVWLDGGTGGDSCPLLEALAEVLKQGWIQQGDQVHILSLGCGYSEDSVSFKRAKMWLGRDVREARVYMDPTDGGLARLQATNKAVHLVEATAKAVPQLTFQRLDCQIPKEIDKMDNTGAIDEYIRIGCELWKQIDLRPFGC